jgi:hypothetical protein
VRCWRPGRPGRWTPSDYGRAVHESISPIFRVADGRVSAEWYARLGFTVTGEHRFAPDLPLRDARPGTLVYLYVDDVDAVAEEFGVRVTTQPWGREVELTDPDGNRLRVGGPGSAEPTA